MIKRAHWLSAILAACTVQACTREVHEAPTPRPQSVAAVGPLDALSRRFGRLRERLRERGYTREVRVFRVFGLEGEGVFVPVDLPVSRCTTVVALGGGGMRNLEMTLFDGNGEEVTVDTVSGEGGLVHACPQASTTRTPTAPHYLVLKAEEGSGAIMAAAIESSQGDGAGFNGLFDGVLAPRVAFREVEERFARSRTAMRARGLLPLGEPLFKSVAEGEAFRPTVAFESDRCYVIMARGGERLRDVDLFLFSPAGAEVGRDLGDDAQPMLEHCPSSAGAFTIEARAYEGAGPLGIMILSAPSSLRAPSLKRDNAQASTDSRPANVVEPSEDQVDPAGALASLASGLATRGYSTPVFVVRTSSVAPGEEQTHDVPLGAGCSIIIAASGRSGIDLDLYLSDPSGRVIDADTGVQAGARVSACTAAPATMRIAVKAYGTEGRYALAALHAPPQIRDLRALRLDQAVASYRGRGYVERSMKTIELDESEQYEQRIVVPAGTCVAMAAAGDETTLDVDLLLRDERGRLVASESGPTPYSAAARCASAAETITASVVMYRGEGSVALQLLERRAE